MRTSESKFGGDVSVSLDEERLGKQLRRVKEIMLKAAAINAWITLQELSLLARSPEASVSARLRDLRKDHFGGFIIERRRRGDPIKGLWEYALKNPNLPVQKGLFE